jgi:hypothetical protein
LVNSDGTPRTPDTISESVRDARAKQLRTKDSAQWTQQETDAYLGYALWSVYSAYEIYKEVMGFMPEDPQWLIGAGYLKAWPQNPYNNWQPMRLLKPGEPFSPGDLVLQTDPAEPKNIELSVYGADPVAPLPWHCKPFQGHEAWAQALPGSRYMVGGCADEDEKYFGYYER